MKRLEKNLGLDAFVRRLAFAGTWTFTLLVALGISFVLLKAHAVYSGKKASSYSDSVLLSGSRSRATAWRAGGNRAAIIIDGLGNDLALAERIFSLEIPVTVAVLPYRRYSREISRRAADHGLEVLLHLPMQPYNYPVLDPGAGCLLLSMDRTRVQAELDAQIASLPSCVGVQPYMGSLFTERKRPMGWVFSVLQERGLFFVDGLATPASVSSEVAQTFGVSCFRRTHLLDETREEAHIVRQLCRVAAFAAAYGGAVGVGHAYPETLASLPKALAAFREKGVEIVRTSEIFSAPHRRARAKLSEGKG